MLIQSVFGGVTCLLINFNDDKKTKGKYVK
jgi:hypothetical protein